MKIPHPWWHRFFTWKTRGANFTRSEAYGEKGKKFVAEKMRIFTKIGCSKCETYFHVYQKKVPMTDWPVVELYE